MMRSGFAVATYVAAVLAAFAMGSELRAEPPVVGITQITEHPALDAVRKGVVDELAARGIAADKDFKLVYENAQGNPANATQITRRFAGLAPKVIVGISTVSAQQLSATIKNVPIVFGAVTDPVAAGLLKETARPEGNVTGVSSLAPIGQQLDLLLKIVPNVKSIGVLHNPGEANSVVLVALLKKEAEKRGLSVREAAVTTSAENGTAARSLVGRVDAIYVPNDNTVVQGIEAIIKVANDSKIPVLAGDTGSVERGALASVGFSYYDIGREVGDRVYKLLNGAKIADIPVQQVQKLEVYLNDKAAAALGVKLPESVKQDAKKIY